MASLPNKIPGAASFNPIGLPLQPGHEKSTPWEWSVYNDAFFSANKIQGDRWNKLYPYKLLVVEILPNGGYEIVNGDNVTVASSYQELFPASGIAYRIIQEPINHQWSFTFPITPQQFSITDQFAINTTATMRGIIEEHNGVKFKIIAMSGTTGIWPARVNGDEAPQAPSILGGFGGSAFEAFGDILKQANKVQSAFTGDKKGPIPGPMLTDTGYYQALYLSQFLERYAQAKKRPDKKNWRLVLDIPKENQSFICTPMQFSLTKSQQKPNEYLWNLQLKAWKRINIAAAPITETRPINLGSPNILSKINSTLRDTRRTLSSSINLIKAVRSDFQAPLEALRQAALAVKDLGGLVHNVIDLPGSIIKDYKSSITESFHIIGSSTSNMMGDMLGVGAGMAGVSDMFRNSNTNSEGLSYEAVSSGALGVDAMHDQQLSPMNELFDKSEANFDFFDAIPVSALTLTPEQQQAVDNVITDAKLITQNDLNLYKAEMLSLALDISNSFGAGDATYASIYGRPTPKTRTSPITIEEDEILVSIFEAIQAFDILTANKFFDDTKTQSPLTYVGQLAANSGIAFDNSTSKFLVPVPFGLSIEMISARYLGTPDKWIEIATLNGLRSPYIDETGFIYNLLSNASGRQFNVDDSLQQLYIGQQIILSSSVVPQQIRHITDVEKISDTNYLITVDGLGDLDSLQTVNVAKMQAYAPGTVNSQNQIYIPTNAAADADDRIALPPAFKNDNLAKISKIDWLLTDQGDIAINNVGDFRLAGGINNLVQALQLKIRTKKGSLLRHLDYGLGLQAGMSIADVESGALLQELTRLVLQDSRFSGIDRLDITLQGVTLKIDMAVRIAASSGILPISFSL